MLKEEVLGNKPFLDNEFSNELMLNLINEKLNFGVQYLPDSWAPLLYQFLFEDEKIYWEKDIIELTYNKMKEIQESVNNEGELLKTLIEALEHFFISVSSYNDIVKSINLNNDFSTPPQTEFRMFYIPLYNSILEGCWTNLLKFWRDMLNLIDSKNLKPQTKLASLVETVNARGLNEITKYIDVDIRNAINHGGVYIVEEKKSLFQFSKGKDGLKTKEKSIYDFKRLIFNLIDNASSTYLGIIKFLIKEDYSINELSSVKNEIVYDSLVKYEISTYHKNCIYMYRTETIHNNSQLNLSFYTDEMSVNDKLHFSIITFLKLYIYYPEIERFYLTFSSERSINSYIIAESTSILKFFNREIDTFQLLKEEIVNKNTHMLWEPYLEEIDINEARNSYFPDYSSENYDVKNIIDISMEDRKRFKAVVYVENAYRRNHIKLIAKEVIEKIKNTKNYPNLKLKTKHGEIPADLVQLTFYKVKARDGRREKHLVSSNENFIGVVQYYSSLEFKFPNTTLKGNFWRDLIFRTEGNIEYAWNPNFGK